MSSRTACFSKKVVRIRDQIALVVCIRDQCSIQRCHIVSGAHTGRDKWWCAYETRGEQLLRWCAYETSVVVRVRDQCMQRCHFRDHDPRWCAYETVTVESIKVDNDAVPPKMGISFCSLFAKWVSLFVQLMTYVFCHRKTHRDTHFAKIEQKEIPILRKLNRKRYPFCEN